MGGFVEYIIKTNKNRIFVFLSSMGLVDPKRYLEQIAMYDNVNLFSYLGDRNPDYVGSDGFIDMCCFYEAMGIIGLLANGGDVSKTRMLVLSMKYDNPYLSGFIYKTLDTLPDKILINQCVSVCIQYNSNECVQFIRGEMYKYLDQGEQDKLDKLIVTIGRSKRNMEMVDYVIAYNPGIRQYYDSIGGML